MERSLRWEQSCRTAASWPPPFLQVSAQWRKMRGGETPGALLPDHYYCQFFWWFSFVAGTVGKARRPAPRQQPRTPKVFELMLPGGSQVPRAHGLMPGSLDEIWGPTESSPPENLLEFRLSGPTPDLWNQNPHFKKLLKWSVVTGTFGECWAGGQSGCSPSYGSEEAHG